MINGRHTRDLAIQYRLVRAHRQKGGGLAGDMLFYPFGQEWGYDNGVNSAWWQFYNSFSRWNASLGFDLTPNRKYSPTLGRWMTPDPSGRKVVNLANPQTWNLYAYVTDNPMTLNDPSGLSSKGCPPPFSKAAPCYGRAGASQWDPFELMNIPVRGMTWVPPSQTDVTIGGIETKSPISPGYWTGGPKVGNGLELFGGAAPAQLMTPTVILQANVFASTLAHNFVSEFKQGGCVSTFLNGMEGADVLGPLGGSPNIVENTVQGTAGSIAASYAAGRALTVPFRSSTVRGILDLGETGAETFAPGYMDYLAASGFGAEIEAMYNGGCH